jgi:hypothetical protein
VGTTLEGVAYLLGKSIDEVLCMVEVKNAKVVRKA